MIKPWSKVERCFKCGGLKVDNVCKCPPKDTLVKLEIIDKIEKVDEALKNLNEYLISEFGDTLDWNMDIETMISNFGDILYERRDTLKLTISPRKEK